MALKKFWNSVSNAFRLGLPTRVISDAPRFDAGSFEKALHDAHVWLTPAAVRDYCPEDFDFLAEETREQLTRTVRQFEQIASNVDPCGPVAEEQLRLARPLFEEIIKIMEFDRFEDAEAFRIGKRIESSSRFPRSYVNDARYRTGKDIYGKRGINIMTYLPDSDDDTFLARARIVRHDIEDLVFEHGKPYFPYLSFRMAGELATLPGIGDDA
jgi:hypothetical protein